MVDSAALVGATLARRFRLDSHLGSGGMGAVFRGTDRRLHRPVAVKVFSLAGARTQDIRRYADEARVLAGLSHPSLVALYDVGADVGPRDEPLAFLVMELVDGPTLQQRIDHGPLSPLEAADVGRQVADALGHAHGAGIVHRDVKPANVLVTHEALLSGDADAPVLTTKLADFGIAQSTARSSARRPAGRADLPTEATLGTASYLSPEQALGEPLGPASDVYSLGLVLLEALTGERAYSGAPLTSSLARLLEPVEVPARLGRGWSALLTAMLSTDPAQRPAPAAVADRLRTLRRPAIAEHEAGGSTEDRAEDGAEDGAGDRADDRAGRRGGDTAGEPSARNPVPGRRVADPRH